jgi:Flp pilus assembly protein TadG
MSRCEAVIFGESDMKRKQQKGVAAVELVLVTPVLLLMALGLIQLSWLLANYMMVSNAASTGAQYFAAQRGTTDPYSSTQTQVTSSAAYLNTKSLSVTTSVDGTSCSSDAACASALSAAVGASSVGVATVSVSYTFTPIISGTPFGLTAAMPSSLSSSVVERVQ